MQRPATLSAAVPAGGFIAPFVKHPILFPFELKVKEKEEEEEEEEKKPKKIIVVVEKKVSWQMGPTWVGPVSVLHLHTAKQKGRTQWCNHSSADTTRPCWG